MAFNFLRKFHSALANENIILLQTFIVTNYEHDILYHNDKYMIIKIDIHAMPSEIPLLSLIENSNSPS